MGGFYGIFVLLLLWHILAEFLGLPQFILPAPLQVFEAFWQNFDLIMDHTLVTLTEVLVGLAIGSILGVLTAILLAASSAVQMFLRPMLIFSQALPVFALAPILTLWFGYGLWSKVAMAVLIIYLPITSAFFDGLVRTPKGFIDLAKTMGATSINTMVKIRIPAAFPSLVSGFKLAAVYAPIGATIGEWVGASEGLGYLMLLANGRVKIDLMFAAMLTLGLVSVGLYLTVEYLSKRLINYD